MNGNRILRLEDIPNIMTMNIPPIEWLIQGMIPRKTITLWTGGYGMAKTFMLQSMAVSVAMGVPFLGRECRRTPVLYLDYENADYMVQDRLNLIAKGPIEGIHVWGTWNEQQPPQIGSDLLLTLAKESRPLIIIDPFRNAHGADENDSTAMTPIMQQLRYCAAAGASIIILHHPAKSENSTGRGSSAIAGAVDLAFLQEYSAETGLITVKSTKVRNGPPIFVTVRPDFEEGSFTVTDSEAFTKRTEEFRVLRQIIERQPGINTRGIHAKFGGRTERLARLLKDGSDSHWTAVPGNNNSVNYYPAGCFPKNGNTGGNTHTRTDGD